MKILATAFAFNERPYLPAWVDYYRKQGCDLFVLDNYSTDKTGKWLQQNNISTKKVNTNDSFNLLMLQQTLNSEIKRINPDWVVYTGIDLFQIFPKGIKAAIEEAENGGYNLIEVQHFEVLNTGEKTRIPLSKNYFYTRKHDRLKMIAKYGAGFKLVADEIIVEKPKVYVSDGILINYGMCKTKAERELTFARRQKAWAEGMHKGWGTHYAPAKSVNWIWDKNTLQDIRTKPEFELIKQTW